MLSGREMRFPVWCPLERRQEGINCSNNELISWTAEKKTHSTNTPPVCKRHPHKSTASQPWTRLSFVCGTFLLLLCVCLHIEGATAAPSVADELLQQMQYREAGGGGDGAECSLDCHSKKSRPVCGNDGITYTSKCHLRRARKCHGMRELEVANKGRCKVKSRRVSGRPSCFRERKEARASRDESSAAGSYVPKCNPDNTYTEVQCYSYRGAETCWCVTPDGKPITGSFKPASGTDVDCSRFIKGKARRRAAAEAVQGGKTRRGLTADGCSKADKTKFNHNLITLFTQEYSRTPEANATTGQAHGTYEKRVIEWKYAQLDEDRNGYIKRGEVRELKRMIKKHVRPKSCARKFEQSCDLDSNKKISRKEWSVCLGIDIHKNKRGKGKGGTRQKSSQGGDSDGGPGPGLLESLPFDLKPSSEEHKEASIEMLEREKLGCSAERQTALEEDRQNPVGRVFIPECTDNDMYKQVQCHSTGYCWCVNESTGRPMPGPATLNETPDCDNIKVSIFKGCPYHLKRRFLQELLDQLSIEMSDAATNTSLTRHVEPDPDHTLEETAVRWKLHMLDKNNNNMLERRETHSFKKDIRKKRSLRKCSRNFLRYCDEDDNGKITMEEWIECTGITEQKNRPGFHGRQGENPLGRYLKSSG